MSNSELSFKSIDNSTNKDEKDWTVLSIKIKKIKSDVNLGCKYCLYRQIAYLDKNNKTYQTGSLYVPLNGLKHFIFFVQLLISGKTFGHYINSKFPNKSRFKLIEVCEIKDNSNLLFDKISKTRLSKRVIYIPISKFKFYVEEELEIF